MDITWDGWINYITGFTRLDWREPLLNRKAAPLECSRTARGHQDTTGCVISPTTCNSYCRFSALAKSTGKMLSNHSLTIWTFITLSSGTISIFQILFMNEKKKTHYQLCNSRADVLGISKDNLLLVSSSGSHHPPSGRDTDVDKKAIIRLITLHAFNFQMWYIKQGNSLDLNSNSCCPSHEVCDLGLIIKHLWELLSLLVNGNGVTSWTGLSEDWRILCVKLPNTDTQKEAHLLLLFPF